MRCIISNAVRTSRTSVTSQTSDVASAVLDVGSTMIVVERGYQLDVTVVLPSDLASSHVRGLLGNFNGFADDDLTSRSGQTLSPNATDETIYFDFGETCE